MDISATDRNPEPGDNPLLFSTDSKGYFRCTQPQTVMHTTKPLLNQLGTTGSNHSEWTRLRIRPLSHRGWHVPGIQNQAADAISRGHVSKFRDLHPDADSNPTESKDLSIYYNVYETII